MALVLCRECGIQVSSEAPTCPGCGVPSPAGAAAQSPTGRSVAAPIYGLDAETHQWVFDRLMSGVPRRPIAKELAEARGIGEARARSLVQQVEEQALIAAAASSPSQRRSGGNVAPALLSLWIPGLGQLTQGRPGRGAALFAGSALLWIVLLGWTVHIAAAVDAARWDPID